MGQGALSGAWSRRGFLATAAALAACRAGGEARYTGGWIGASHERGHALRDAKSGSMPEPSVRRRADVLVIGTGVAGLACARELVRRGRGDVHLLELEDRPGGNSRDHSIGGMACPLGAHYLPTPGDKAWEVAQLLDDLGVRRVVHGKPVYDEMHLCHSPQERIFIEGHWHDGLLPPVEALPAADRSRTLAQYRRFEMLVSEAGRGNAFAIPSSRAAWTESHDRLDAVTFSAWLDGHGLDAPALRWYLDYCCRDDYGSGAAEVSAWAGLHYFASRHGFHAPGSDHAEREAVLTWPEGNGWLTARMAAPLKDRIHTGRVAWRVAEERQGVVVNAWHVATKQMEQWTASQVVMATPLFIARRLLAAAPAALVQAAAGMRHAPWMVANVHLHQALSDRPGAAPSWDNVRYGAPGLGYVDAMHQSTRPHPGPTVLTSYGSWGADPAHRAALLRDGWAERATQVVQELSLMHPDLPPKVRQVDLMRYGHAMSIPAPGVRGSPALRALARPHGRIHFAHADLSGYSIFEEAMHHGVRAAADIAGSAA